MNINLDSCLLLFVVAIVLDNSQLKVACIVNAESHLETGAAVTVRNSPKFRLPETGGMGTTVFTVVGLGVMGAAAGLYVLSRRKKEA